MERNQIIGFVLIFLILVGWSIINQPTQEEIQAAKEKQRLEQEAKSGSTADDSVEAVSGSLTSDQVSVEDLPDSLLIQQQAGQYGIFAGASVGESNTYTLENDVISITLSNKGGKIVDARLKEHEKVAADDKGNEIKSPLRLLEDERNKWNYVLDLGNLRINSEDLYFTAKQTGNEIAFKATTTTGGFVEQRYRLGDDYTLDYDLTVDGISNQLDREQPIVLEIDNYLDRLEKNVDYERRFSTVYFKPVSKDSKYCNCMKSDVKDVMDKEVEWVSFSNQFFNTSLISRSAPFDGVIASTEMYDKDQPDLKRASTVINMPYQGSSSETIAMALYVGPNEYRTLKQFDNDLEEIIPFGRSLFGDINRHLIRPFFNFLLGFINSKGIVIIVLIFLVKMAFYPLTYKMLHSQAKMGVLKPQLASLKNKFKDDAQRQQMETMKVYREYGVSPFGGCLPMLVQTPIWYALFRFFPASISFRQERFLWANDLSSYDALFYFPFEIPGLGSHLSLFTILWAITTVVYTFYNTRHMDMTANPAMKYVQYLMPLMFFFFFNKYASGLTCYMFFSQLFTVAQTILTKKFVFNDEKILAELNKQKAKPKKQNSFMQKLQEAQERQQKLQQQRTSAQKKKPAKR
ncbi:MAG: membrane protein insertase YidC [Bacteroidota bacterium]